ncbi:MAG: hypothetical protein D6718_10925 [Acidobacteria bacterium]|nr:MAG: hypothetical protein D6718_10925 [Acidobacteriota bacterium]
MTARDRKPVVWLDGRYLRRDRARIPVDDPAVRRGVGLFETVRAYKGRCFRLADHVDRLRRSAAAIGLEVEIPALEPVVAGLLRRNGLREARVRIVCTGGGRVLVSAEPCRLPPRRVYREGARLEVAPWRRDPRAPLAGHKSLSYHELMLARRQAERAGAIDAILLSPSGHVLEGTRSNLFAVRRGALLTPPASGILPGVTRRVVLDLAAGEGLAIVERPLSLRRLVASDEVFVTSSMMEIVPVAKIGQREIGRPGPVTRALSRAYRRRVREELGQ